MCIVWIPLWSDQLLHFGFGCLAVWFLKSWHFVSCSSPCFGNVTSCDGTWKGLTQSWCHGLVLFLILDQCLLKTSFVSCIDKFDILKRVKMDYLSFVCLQTCSCPARLPLPRARGWAGDQSSRRSPPVWRHPHLQRSCVLKWQACVANETSSSSTSWGSKRR